MKKVLTFLIIMVLITTCFVGCGKKKEVNDGGAPEAYSFVADIEYKEDRYKAEVVRKKGGNYQVKILEPENLNDFIFSYEDGQFKVNYMGIELAVNPSTFPDTSIGKLFINTFNKMYDGTCNIQRTDDHLIFKGAGDQGDFEVWMQKKNNAITKVSIPGIEFEANITEFNNVPN